MLPLDTEQLASTGARLGQQSAATTLKAIACAYPGKLLGTFSLVALENLLMLAYPLFAGFAIDAIVRGEARLAVLYALVVLGFWVVGAARRAVDTRTFTRIYAELAVPVVLYQRRQQHGTSKVAARVVLAREFVDFFEKQIPVIATALVSIVGAAAMLLAIEPWVGAACLLALSLCLACLPRFATRNQALHERLNDRLEQEVALVGRVGRGSLLRHYRHLSSLRVRLSDREAVAYLLLGVMAALLFVVAITCLASAEQAKAGHIYAVMTYLWTFVGSLDEAPSVVDQLARLRDIGKRVDIGRDDTPA